MNILDPKKNNAGAIIFEDVNEWNIFLVQINWKAKFFRLSSGRNLNKSDFGCRFHSLQLKSLKS